MGIIIGLNVPNGVMIRQVSKMTCKLFMDECKLQLDGPALFLKQMEGKKEEELRRMLDLISEITLAYDSDVRQLIDGFKPMAGASIVVSAL